MLNVECQRQEGERVLTQLTIELGHVKEKCLFVTKMKVVLNTVIYSEFSIMIGQLLAIYRLEGLKIIYQFIFPP